MRKHSKLLDTILKYLVAAIIIAVPLYPKFPFIRVPGTFVSIRLEDVLLLIAAIYWLLFIFPGIRDFIKNNINKAVILYLFVGFISLTSAVLVTQTVIPHIGFLHWLRRIEYFIPLFVGISAIKRRPADLEFFFKLIVVVIFLAFIYGIGQRYFGWPIIITQNEEYSKGVALRWVDGSHINSTFAGHYDLATFLVLCLPIVISSLFLLRGKVTKVILFSVWIEGLWLLVNTASRISLVSYMISAITALVLARKYKVIPVVLLISILFTGFSSNLQSRYLRIIQVGRERLQEIKILYRPDIVTYAAEEDFFLERKTVEVTPTQPPVFEDRSTSIRFNVEWPRAIRAFSKNPLLGTGYSSITLASDSDYLRLLGEVGILGFLTFFFIIINIASNLVKTFPFFEHFDGLKLAFIAGITASLPGLFLNAVFIDIFEASKFAIIFWLLIGMTISLVFERR